MFVPIWSSNMHYMLTQSVKVLRTLMWGSLSRVHMYTFIFKQTQTQTPRHVYAHMYTYAYIDNYVWALYLYISHGMCGNCHNNFCLLVNCQLHLCLFIVLADVYGLPYCPLFFRSYSWMRQCLNFKIRSSLRN